MQEGKVQGVTGCSPSGFRQVKVAVCGPYLLGCQMGPCNMAVLSSGICVEMWTRGPSVSVGGSLLPP